MRKRITGFLLLIVVIAVYMVACRKEFQDSNSSLASNQSDIRFWLHDNGYSYSNETIAVRNNDGSLAQGKLLWDRATTYHYGSREYMDIPFSFGNEGLRLPGGDSSSGMGFTLVVRKNSSGKYEAAIRSAIYDNLTTNLSTGVVNRLTTQSYQLLDGTLSTYWQERADGSYIAGRRLTDAELQLRSPTLQIYSGKRSSGGKGKLMSAPAPSSPGDCYTTTSSERVQICWSYADAGSYGGQGVACTMVTVTTVTEVCPTNTSEGGGGTTGGTPPSGGGSGGWPPPTKEDTKSQEDPCKKAKNAAQKATSVAKINGYKEGLSKVNVAAAADGKEHSVALNEDASGNIISPTTVSNGGETNTSTPINDNTYATLHNHTNGSPPSVGDIYGLIKGNSQHSKFTTKFVTLGDNGPVYALVITDPVAANEFLNAYPPDNENSFPEDLNDEWSNIFNAYGYSQEIATAYILDKYVKGVALLKQNTDGSFSRLGATKTDNNEGKDPEYVQIKCNY